MNAVIPEIPEEVTPQWLTQSLSAYGVLDAGEVVGFDREQLGEGKGFLGDLFRLSLKFNGDDAPQSLIVKMPKLANRIMGELMGAYEREILFYQHLAPMLPVRTPRVYFSAFDWDADSEKQQEILGRMGVSC